MSDPSSVYYSYDKEREVEVARAAAAERDAGGDFLPAIRTMWERICFLEHLVLTSPKHVTRYVNGRRCEVSTEEVAAELALEIEHLMTDIKWSWQPTLRKNRERK